MSQQEKEILLRVLTVQAEEAKQDSERMKAKGLPAEYDKGVFDGLTIAISALRRAA